MRRGKKKLTDSPLLYFAYQLSEELGEIDPYRVLNLPANTLLGWQAYFALKSEKPGVIPPSDIPPSPESAHQPTSTSKSVEQQCSDVMKMIGR
ncbi:tail assembly chaperone [Proteus sp. G2663]|nr:tail assembly chaperone [Proteus sp. G2663]